MAPEHRTCRREFMKTTAATAAAFAIVPRHVLGGPGHVPPSDRINVGLVGAGGRGLQNARELMKLDDVRITAVADPAERWDLSGFYYGGVAGRVPVAEAIHEHYRAKENGFACQQYEDYREMLDRESSLDAILCATPDHAHAVVSLDAMRAGKHVYCEKPLTHNIAEARLVARVARESGVATQMGNQGHSREGIRRTCEIIQSGLLGDIMQVNAWVPASRWNPTLVSTPSAAEPLPQGLDWGLWCGPRTPPPFHSAYAPVAWRDFWTFGCGALGDFGCHDLDSSVWGLDLHAPQKVEFHPAGKMTGDLAPHGEIGYYDFGAEKDRAAVRIVWFSGGLKPSQPKIGDKNIPLPSRGVLFFGTRGVMLCGGAGADPVLFPESLQSEAAKVESTIARSSGHHRDWIDAIKGGPPASSNFEYGARLTEITLLGLVALRTGKAINWNAEEMTVSNVQEADEIIHGSYRSGWKPAGLSKKQKG